MVRVVREVHARVQGENLTLVGEIGRDGNVNQLLFVYDTAFEANPGNGLQELVAKYGCV